MSDADDLLAAVVAFILNEADAPALETIERAVAARRRQTTGPDPGAAAQSAPTAPGGLAQGTAQRIAQQLESTLDVGKMARDVVRQLILQHEPGISEQHLDVLLDAWVPERSGQQPGGGAESALPAEAVMAMITQFVTYSLGAMPVHEQRQLPDRWSQRYWAVFSSTTQALIKQLLTGAMEPAAFWGQVRQHLAGNQAGTP